jgi:glycosyltransferase involved in cell wall biosynthesis
VRPRILCISLSPLLSDSRVLRQIGVLGEFGDVTTVGFGEAPPGVAEHIRVPDGLPTLPQTPAGVLRLALRRWRASELAAPAIRFAHQALEGRRFDLVVANEARALGLAHAVAHGAPVWADMHEWAPEERTHILSWRILVAPLMRHLCATYLPRSGAVTAVCDSIARLYDEAFGVRTRVVRNAGPWRDLAPSAPEEGRIRLVHSGTAVHGRRIELMIDVVRRLDERYTLDLYLLPAGDGGAYLQQLKDRAAGDPRIRFNDPVPPQTLPDVLNRYDVGVFWIPPTHTNARYALPNKFFDFVQARLAVAVGPSVEMASLAERFGLGAVSAGFEVEDCIASMTELTPERIEAAKRASDAASHELSFETDGEVARQVLRDLLR